MVSPLVEGVNACLGLSLLITFIVTLSVALANADCCIDTSSLDNATLTQLHYATDTVTATLSDLDIDVDAYGPVVQVGCRLAEIECPHKISGVAVASIVTGIMSVLFLLLGLALRVDRRTRRSRNGRVRLYPEL